MPDSYISISTIIEVLKHPKGGHLVTTEGLQRLETHSKGGIFSLPKKEWVEKPITREWLRPNDYDWFTWPALSKVEHDSWRTLNRLWVEYQTRQKYSPPPGPYTPKAKGNPNRCMFCHTDLSKMAAHCLKCGGAMHLSCAGENGDTCITPGCGATDG